MTNSRKVVLGSMFRVFALGANVGVGFLLMPFVVHSLGDRLFGYWTLIGTLLGYYGLLDLGIVSAIQYYVAKAIGEKDADYANEVISTAFFAFALLGLLVLVMALLISSFGHGLITEGGEAALFKWAVIVTGVGFAIGFPCRVLIGVLAANLRFDLSSVVDVGCLLCRAGMTVAALRAGYGVVGLAIVTVVTDLLTYFFYFIIVRKVHYGFQLSKRYASVRVFKQIIGYSSITFITKLSDQLRFYMHSIIVGTYVSIAAVTHYSIAAQLNSYLMSLMIALLGLLGPYFSTLLGQKDHSQIQNALRLSTKISISVSAFCVLCLMLYGKPFIRLWMGKAYLDAYVPLAILLAGRFFDVSQVPSTSYLYGVAKHKLVMYLALTEGLLNLALSLYLVKEYGMIGVALGTAIPLILVRLIIQPVCVSRLAAVSAREYYLRNLSSTVMLMVLTVVIPWWILSRMFVFSDFMKLSLAVGIQVLVGSIVTLFVVLGRKVVVQHLRVAFASEGLR